MSAPPEHGVSSASLPPDTVQKMCLGALRGTAQPSSQVSTWPRPAGTNPRQLPMPGFASSPGLSGLILGYHPPITWHMTAFFPNVLCLQLQILLLLCHHQCRQEGEVAVMMGAQHGHSDSPWGKPQVLVVKPSLCSYVALSTSFPFLGLSFPLSNIREENKISL